MDVLGIYGSPRHGGNSDRLLDEALKGARSAGAQTKVVYVRSLKMSGCTECGGCNETGECVFQDDMRSIYPLLEEAGAIILASPIFFYSLPSQAKALVDRAQSLWQKRRLTKTPEELRVYDGGKGYLIAVGATQGKKLFDGVQLVARYFYDALDMSYEGGAFFRGMEHGNAAEENPEALREAFNLGLRAAGSEQKPS